MYYNIFFPKIVNLVTFQKKKQKKKNKQTNNNRVLYHILFRNCKFSLFKKKITEKRKEITGETFLGREHVSFKFFNNSNF